MTGWTGRDGVPRKLKSVSVMANRVEPAGGLEFFPTPPWGTRAALVHVLPQVWPHPDLYTCTAWDPCCGEGHMARVLEERFMTVMASDIHDYGHGAAGLDFLDPATTRNRVADWIFMNFPFSQGERFITQALTVARRGVAVLARSAFGEGQGRYRRLFSRRPPQLEALFSERLPVYRGRYVVGPRAKSATSYTWFIWLARPPHDWRHTRKIWIPPCRQDLERPGDWIDFGACEDLPKNHKVFDFASRASGPAALPSGWAGDGARRAVALAPSAETSLADIRRELEAMLPGEAEAATVARRPSGAHSAGQSESPCGREEER